MTDVTALSDEVCVEPTKASATKSPPIPGRAAHTVLWVRRRVIGRTCCSNEINRRGLEHHSIYWMD